MFKNRSDAGEKLAQALLDIPMMDAIILALPRGGVIVGLEVAKKLNLPLDILVVRKLGSPFQPEFGIGAIAPEGVRVLDKESIKDMDISEKDVDYITKKEEEELERRIKLYRQNKPPLNLNGKTVVLVDDGLATGISAKAALEYTKNKNPGKIILATPICPKTIKIKLKCMVDEIVCIETPEFLGAVGSFYGDFTQVTDEQVISALS